MVSHKQRYFAAAITLLALLISSALSCAFAARPAKLTLRHDGLERKYLLYCPPFMLTASDLKPLLLALHGGGGTHRGMVRLTKSRFNELADRDGFFVVYPQGIDKAWNDGRGDLVSEAHRRRIDARRSLFGRPTPLSRPSIRVAYPSVTHRGADIAIGPRGNHRPSGCRDGRTRWTMWVASWRNRSSGQST